MSSNAISKRPQKSFSRSPPGTPLVRRQLGPFLSKATGRRSSATTEECCPKQSITVQIGAPKATRGGQSGDPPRVTVATNYDEGDNDKEVDDSDVELIATIERNFKRQARQPTDHFEKLLEATCPNHVYPVRHKLKKCSMMKNYMTMGAFTKGKKIEGDRAGKATAPFPREKAVMSIYSGPAPHESERKRKLTSWAFHAICPATLEYLRWSESLITFDQTNHLDSISKPERFSLIVDPLVGTIRLTKALMDEGGGLNLMYLNTFEGLG
jgi:hypothetical protein